MKADAFEIERIRPTRAATAATGSVRFKEETTGEHYSGDDSEGSEYDEEDAAVASNRGEITDNIKDKRKVKSKSTGKGKGKGQSKDTSNIRETSASKRLQSQKAMRDEVMKDHLLPCGNCEETSPQQKCLFADANSFHIKCTPCVVNKRTSPTCEHKAWLDTYRIRKYTEARNFQSKLEAACIAYGKLDVFGHPRHDKVPAEQYMTVPWNIRKTFCRLEFWRSPPSLGHAASQQSTGLEPPPPPPMPASAPPAQPTLMPLAFTRKPTNFASASTQQSATAAMPVAPAHKQAVVAPLNSTARASIPQIRGDIASAQSTPSRKRRRWSNGDGESHKLDPRYPFTFCEGREPLITDKEFVAAVKGRYLQFLTDHYIDSSNTHLERQEKELATSGLKDAFLNDIHKLLNFRGGDFTTVFGLASKKSPSKDP